jgi:2-methylcitrate dehydratase PrpD
MRAPDLLPSLARLLVREVDDRARRRAAHHLLDWLGCAAAGLREPLAQVLAARTARAPEGPAAAWGCGYRTPEAALLQNGALGNLLEMDDVHREALLHPGPVVIPAALAACTPATPGRALLDAIVRGYEAMIRVGRAIGRSHYAFWHPTSTCGAFGAAAACASLRGLEALPTAWSLGSAGSRTGGLWQMRHEDVPTKSLHNAETARAGWLAAELAALGVTGPLGILDGPQGLFVATSSDADPVRVLADADAWLLAQVSFKPWPACRHAHPAIDALLALAPLPAPEAVAGLTVHTYREAVDFCDRPQPRTALEAKFSLQHALAAILALGRPALAHYAPDALGREPLPALRARVRVLEDPALSARFPRHFGARVSLALRDGRVLEHAVADAWGDPEWPLDAAALAAKASALMRYGGLAEARIEALHAAVATLPEGDCGALLAAIAEPA